jgi:branched-subunit amino acid aminotransferase/4-amino-4-deoxychorismate lyase
MSESDQIKVMFNGQLIPAVEAKVSIDDPGFLHGASVFTTMLAHNGTVFRFERHLARLAETIRVLGLQVQATTGELVRDMYALLHANGLARARCRITLTPGPPGGDPATIITAKPLPEYPPQWYDNGIGVVVTALKQHTGDPIFGYKTGCYLPRILALAEASAKGAQDALWYTTDNRLAESCFSNVFLVLGGKVCTPPRDTPVLPGVVREAVIELCAADGLECDESTPLTVKEMLRADEIFLTNSTMGIRPVTRVEKHSVGDELPGPITRKLMAAYRNLLDRECREQGEEGQVQGECS